MQIKEGMDKEVILAVIKQLIPIAKEYKEKTQHPYI